LVCIVSFRFSWTFTIVYDVEAKLVDGTRIKAVNNKDRNFTRAFLTQFIKAADAKLEDCLQRLDKNDATERAPSFV
jgi:hypothetical protein